VVEGVSRVGPARLTLADVASVAGVSTGALVQRFGTKRGLLRAFTRWSVAETLRTMRAAYNAAPDPVEGLVRAMVGSIGPDPEPEEFANHLAFLHLELADPEFRAILADYDAAVQNELATYLAEAVDKGQLAVNDVEGLASTLNALRHGTRVAWAIARDGSLADAARHHIETFLAPYRRARSSIRGNTTEEKNVDGAPT